VSREAALLFEREAEIEPQPPGRLGEHEELDIAFRPHRLDIDGPPVGALDEHAGEVVVSLLLVKCDADLPADD
jgi:hypothetical protein